MIIIWIIDDSKSIMIKSINKDINDILKKYFMNF